MYNSRKVKKSAEIALGALVLLHIVFALLYASNTPYRAAGLVYHAPAKDIGAPDERQHANYVDRLLKGGGIPTFNPADPNLYETYQSHQPPLYYFLAAGWAKVVGVEDVTNPSAGVKMRTLNVLIGGVTIVGVYFLAFWGYGRRNVALTAAAFAALLPMNIALSGAVSNDPLLFCLCTWTLAFFVRAFNDGWTMRWAVAAGVLLGAALLTKSLAALLLPPLFVGLILTRKSKPNIKAGALALGIGLVLVAGWWVRNTSLYGDPLAMKAFKEAFTGSASRDKLPGPPDWFSYFTNWVGWWTIRSFLGVFGYMDIFLDEKLYRIAFAVLTLLGFGGVYAVSRPEIKPFKTITIVNATFVTFALLSFIQFNIQYFQGQARYLMPAIGPIAICMSLGLLSVFKWRWKTALGIWTLAFVALNLYIVNWLPAEFAKRMLPPGMQ